jgi:hypothetical protein
MLCCYFKDDAGGGSGPLHQTRVLAPNLGGIKPVSAAIHPAIFSRYPVETRPGTRRSAFTAIRFAPMACQSFASGLSWV